MRLGIILAPAAMLASVLAPLRAEWADFAPRAFESGSYVEAYAAAEEDITRSDGQSTGWNDNFFREKLTLFSDGYVYHPRFLQFQMSASGLLKQEDFDQRHVGSEGFKHDSGSEYTGRLFFLPEHPYNVELFALRREPLYRERSATQHDTVETSEGGNFRFRRRPYFFHGGYVNTTTRAQTSRSSVERLTLDGEYFHDLESGGQTSLSASFSPSRFDDDLGLDGDSKQYSMNGLLNLQRARLSVLATGHEFDQESPLSGQVDSDQFGFQERLSLDLPWNFEAHAYYRLQENDATTSDPSGAGVRRLSDNGEDFEAILEHRLYESLDTRYVFLRDDRTSTDGEATTLSHSLGLHYTKQIPRGRVLGGTDLSRSRTDSSGQAEVASESHPATPVPGSFNLDQQNVDEASLAVFLASPLPPFELILLVEGVHYSTALIANTLQITVFSLPPQFVVPGTYDFVATYSVLTGDYELRTDTYGFNASVQLLDNLLTPYYSHLAVRSDLLTGEFPGSPVDSTTDTVGLTVQRGPWRAVAEYQSLDWDVSPYHAWRTEVQHIGSIDPTLRLYATAWYLDRYYPHGTSPEAPDAYSEQSASVSGSLQKDLVSRTVMLAAGGSYSWLSGTLDSNSHTLNASVIWRIGKLELSAGVDAYGSNTQGTGTVDSSRDRRLYYVKVSRGRPR